LVAPLIGTERLLIRSFAPSDWKDVWEYLSDPLTYVFEPGEPLSEEQARFLSEERSKSHEFLAVELRQKHKVIGHLSFYQIDREDLHTWELGYIFNPSYQMQGYATESVRAIVQYGFGELHVHRIVANCNPENIASWRVLEKAGFVREGLQRKNIYFRINIDGVPIWQDTFNYAILAIDLKTNVTDVEREGPDDPGSHHASR
jgi:ribosomal-protein-alanine N-acetyltransferase